VTSGSPADDLRRYAGARRTAARCTFSFDTAPHEALLYAVFLAGLHDRMPAEQTFLHRARVTPPNPNDLVTASLRDELGS
jgi:hypothetical protein